MAAGPGETSTGRPAWRWPVAIGAGLLFAAQVVAVSVPVPPADRGDLLGWVADHLVALQIGNELKMFAAVLLLAGVIGIARTRRPATALELVAVAAFALASVLLAAAVVIEGRLAYPIFALQLTADTGALVVSLTYGTQHAVYVLVAVGVLAASFASSGAGRKLRLGAGAVTGIAQVAASFPWLMPAWVSAVAAAALLLWTLAAVRLHTGSTADHREVRRP